MITDEQKQIEIYQTDDGQTQIEVRLEQDTVWLTQAQMAELFGRERSVITKHISNVFKDGELDREAVCAKFAHTAEDGKVYQTQGFNLDVIISVGYRVKSPQGVRFRQWATSVLREYLIQGYSLNQARFEKNADELEQALSLIRKAAHSPELSGEAGRGLIDIVSRYTQTFLWLQRYDEGLLEEPAGKSGGQLPNPKDAMQALETLKRQLIERGEATDLFARPTHYQ